MTTINKLGLGVNLLGYTGDIDMAPGEALMATDVLPRVKGDVMSHWGYTRHNPTSLTGYAIWHKGFTYKGKNSGAHDVRPGNYGADTGAIFTRRADWYTAQLILLSDGTAARWDAATQDYIAVALPVNPAVTALADPHPSGFVAQNNLYISGFADYNLRYDPTDELLYAIGWPSVPTIAPTLVAGASTLIEGATYSYRASWVDLYTGEQSGLGPAVDLVPTALLPSVNLVTPGRIPNYGAGINERHWYTNATPEDSDIGIVIYRTEADKGQYNFLGMVYPYNAAWNGLALSTLWTDGTALVDNGLATDASRPASTRTYFDPPNLDTWVYHKKMWWGLSWGQEARDISERAVGKQTPAIRNPNRVYYNDFSGLKSQLERWKPLDYREISTGEGDVLTCVAASDRQLTVFSTETAYELMVKPNFTTGSMQAVPRPLDYTVGAVGPRAWVYQGGYIYWLSRKGPYRTTPGGIPQRIGRLLSPMFIDPESGICQLNSAAALRSQVAYDQDAEMIRFVCPVGSSTMMNRHFGYWTLGEEENGSPYHGWFFFSPKAQWLDFTNAMGGLDPDTGFPENQFQRDNRLVFSDVWDDGDWGYVNQYEIGSQRGGLDTGLVATGYCLATSTNVLINTDAALFNAGDGMEFMRLEVVHADGTIDVREVFTNGVNTIVPTEPFSQAAAGATFYVAGVPAQWLSWVDHDGDPHAHKDLTHLWLSFNRQTTDPNTLTDVTVAAANDFPGTFDVRSTVNADRNTQGVLVASVGRFWQYEFANSRPDERFCLTSLDREFKPLARRQR